MTNKPNRLPRFLKLSLTLSLAVSASTAAAESSVRAGGDAPALEQGRKLIAEAPLTTANLSSGIAHVERALDGALAPGQHLEAQLLLSRAHLRRGELEKRDERAIQDFDAATAAARRALALDPDHVDAKLLVTISAALAGERKGPLNALGQVTRIKRELHQLVEEHPDYLRGREALARVYFRLPGLAGGSNAKAIELLEENLRRDPDYTPSQLALARVLADEGEEDRARQLALRLTKTRATTAPTQHRRFVQPQAEELLQQLR